MALNSFKCNYLTPLHFKGLTDIDYVLAMLAKQSIVSIGVYACVCLSAH